jgi:hypothetical protein
VDAQRCITGKVEGQRCTIGAIIDFADTFALDSGLRATPGYDDVTGVGTPDRAYLSSFRGGR